MQRKKVGLLQRAFIESQLESLVRAPATVVQETDSLSSVIAKMVDQNMGCMVVTNSASSLTGIFTERDVVRRVFSKVADLSTTPISTVMTPKPQTLEYNSSIGRALHLMAVGGFRHIPVHCRDGSWSVISVRDFIKFLSDKLQSRKEREERGLEVFRENNEVERFLSGLVSSIETKPAITVTETTLTAAAIAQMNKHSASCLIITAADPTKVRGVFSERDALKKVIRESSTAAIPIAEFMTKDPVTFLPDTSVLHALRTMNERAFRHVPLVDSDERLLGVLSIQDLIRALAEGVVQTLGEKNPKRQGRFFRKSVD